MSRNFLVILVYAFTSCNAQTDSKNFNLIIINRSSSAIDSVHIHLRTLVSKTIVPNEIKTIKIPLKTLKTSGEGAFQALIFQKNKKFRGHWGLFDWGTFFKNYDSIYVFDNGVSYYPYLNKPSEFELYLYVNTTAKIDSIEFDKGIIIKSNKNQQLTEYTLNYSLFEQKPTFKIYSGAKNFEIRFEHDWNNWNNNQEILYIQDNGKVTKHSELK